MRYKNDMRKTTIAILILVGSALGSALVLSAVYGQAKPKVDWTQYSDKTPRTNGRFQIVLNPQVARDTFLLDSANGSVYQCVINTKGERSWEEMAVIPYH